MRQLSEAALIARVIERLAETYVDLPSGQVTAIVNDALTHFNSAPLREYVPVLVERRARAELTTAQRRRGLVVIDGAPAAAGPVHGADAVAV
jgi:hypothetical protein